MYTQYIAGMPIRIYGSDHIEETALHQLYQAAKLPISVAAALMPDAHSGYGLPIGGVLAADNAVIPYGVGVDIGCRMCLSIFAIDPKTLKGQQQFYARELDAATLFGSGAQFEQSADHELMDDPRFKALPLLKRLQSRAWKQLGSSGSGNHFAEFGIVTIDAKDAVLDLEPGEYLGFLTHSGSRALGAQIAMHYTNVAIEQRRLSSELKNLAWLSMEEAAGQEYWLAMNLAGDYAAACHEVIHHKIAKRLKQRAIRRIANHHNFAWKEMLDGREVIVHRKGATPAGKDVLGIIPGSMTADGFIVKGRGEAASVNSAAHGAGRKMSRGKALESVTHSRLRKALQSAGVQLLGGGLDEAPFAYKDIDTVMAAQADLVETVGRFTPKIVKMDGR